MARALQPGVSLPLLHRSVLDSKESNLKAALQELESERGKERALQSRLEEEQLQHLQREGQSSKTLEVPGRGAGGGRWGWQVGGWVGGGGAGRWERSSSQGPAPRLPVVTCLVAGCNSSEAGLRLRYSSVFVVTDGCSRPPLSGRTGHSLGSACQTA